MARKDHSAQAAQNILGVLGSFGSSDTRRFDRVYARARRSGVVKTGVSAGLPHRHQTDSSQHLRWQDALALVDAEQFAASISLPLNTFATIDWRWTMPRFDGGDPSSWISHHATLSRTISDVLRKNGMPLTWIYQRERALSIGGHTHFLLHLPLAKRTRLINTLDEAIRLRSGITHFRGLHFWHRKMASEMTPKQRLGIMKYFFGSINPDELALHGPQVLGLLPAFLGINAKSGVALPYGLKRVGTSQDIGPGERKRGGWADRTNLIDLAGEIRRYGDTSSTTVVAPSGLSLP